MISKTLKEQKSSMRLEDERLLIGQGRFVDNLNFDNQVYLHVVRSYLGHAKILSINTDYAIKKSGVLAVFTGEDLILDGVLPIPVSSRYKRPNGSSALYELYHALADGVVRFVGQPVAIVIADSKINALEGGECLEIEYEEMASVTDLNISISPNAPTLCNDLPNNIAASSKGGNAAKVEEAFAGAFHVTSMNLINNRVVGSPLEPRALICEKDQKSGDLVLHAMHQSISRLQSTLCKIFQIDREKVKDYCT